MKTHTANYPDETKGSRIARENREKANSLTDGDRERLMQLAIDIIKGEDPKAKLANRAGH